MHLRIQNIIKVQQLLIIKFFLIAFNNNIDSFYSRFKLNRNIGFKFGPPEYLSAQATRFLIILFFFLYATTYPALYRDQGYQYLTNKKTQFSEQGHLLT